MFINNFLAPIQVRLSANFVSHTLIPLATGDKVIKFWKVKVKVGGGGMVCALLNALLVVTVILEPDLQNILRKILSLS